MKRNFFNYAIITVLSVFAFGCEKDDVSTCTDKKVELYLLDEYSTISSSSFQIDETTIKTKATPIIYYDDFISYDPLNYTFEISSKAMNKIISSDLYKEAFAIKANGIFIYSGYFWTGLSSLSCDWVVMTDLSITTDNKFTVELGYGVENVVIPDNRNNNIILEMFASDNKLIE